ncbi:MAG: 5-formyltetrahydrofolate cyclo-ligase [bacterium]|nr:5-formyltetrahydrofolate cyclo-ligase [bacterium]
MENRIKRLRIWISSLKGKIFIDRDDASRRICAEVEKNERYKKAATVLLFSSLKDEVDTRRLINNALSAGKNVFLPSCDGKKADMTIGKIGSAGELMPGAYGILEPKQKDCSLDRLADIEVAVLPGVAFDLDGNRIGRGKGYYDRFLKRMKNHTFRIGVAFDFQLLKKIGGRIHDEPVDLVITEARVVKINRTKTDK